MASVFQHVPVARSSANDVQNPASQRGAKEKQERFNLLILQYLADTYDERAPFQRRYNGDARQKCKLSVVFSITYMVPT